MKNDIYKKYSEEVFNKEENYEKIILNSKDKRSKIRILLSAVAVALVIFAIGFVTPEIYARIQYNIEFKEYSQRDYEIGQGAISDKVEDGYLEKVNMDYIEQDGIKIKVDSMIITDDHFQADINFLFDEGIVLDSERFHYSYAIYDDEKNVYELFLNMKELLDMKKYSKTTRNFYRDIGIKYNPFKGKTVISTHGGYTHLSAENRNIISQIEMDATKEHYPRSKKIYIRIFDLGYLVELSEEERKSSEFSDEFVELSDAEWIFEIDVPEKFYDRETVYLKPKEEVPGIEFNKIELTEMGLLISGRYAEITEFWRAGLNLNDEEFKKWSKERSDFVYITDGDGTRYDSVIGGSGSEKNSFYVRYLVGKKMLDKKLYLNHSMNGVLTTVELIQK